MKAAHVMTTPVISVDTETPVRDVARLLADNGISAVPVLDEGGKLVGIVSEGDLMRRTETATERHRSWWLDLFAANSTLATEYLKSHGRVARDVMSEDVLTVTDDTSLVEIADLLEKHRIKRLPVLRGGQMVGIVSRSNLVQALASLREEKVAETARDDAAIRERLLGELRSQKWAEASPGNVLVTEGIVHFWGNVLSEAERRALRVAAERIAGVRGVEDHTVLAPDLPPV